jgi:hypothetical protein
MKKLSFVLVMVLLLSVSFTTMAQEAAGCPEGLWTDMSPELESACKGELAGTVVTMNGPFTDEDEVKFNASIEEFEAWTGIDIQYTGSKEFEAAIRASVEGGAPPDIADFPQPGLLKGFVADGYVLDVSTFLNADWLKTNYTQSWLDMAMIPGPEGEAIMAGIWARYNGKSLVCIPRMLLKKLVTKFLRPGKTSSPSLIKSWPMVAHPGASASNPARRLVGRRRTGWKNSCCARPRWKTMTSGHSRRLLKTAYPSPIRW